MQEEPRAEFGPARQEPRRQRERDAVEVRHEELVEAGIDAAHQGQRREEVLAELAVGDPGLPLGIRLERERVDEDGLRAAELDVEPAGVLQRHPPRHGPSLDLQRRQRRRLELAEAPLVGVADERDRLGRDHLVRRPLDVRGLVGLLMRDEEAGVDQLAVEARLDQAVVVGFCLPVDLSEEPPAPPEDEAGGVAEGGGVDGRLSLSHPSGPRATSASSRPAGRSSRC